MKRKDRFASKDSFFYALVILATLVVTRYGFLVELVEQTGVFRVRARERTKLAPPELRIKYLEAKMKEKQSVAAELPAGNVRLSRTAPVGTRLRLEHLRHDQSSRWAGDAVLEQLASLLVRARIKSEALPRRCDIGRGGWNVVETKVEQSCGGVRNTFGVSHGNAPWFSVSEIVTNARNSSISGSGR